MSDTAVKTPEKKPGFQLPPTLSYIVSDLGKNGIFLALIAVVVLFSITTNGILLRPQNISNLIVQNGYILILAIGMVLVIVAGHIDTVPINDNLPSRLEPAADSGIDPVASATTGTLWGRGTVDMKGGCAVMLALAVSLTEPVYDVTYIWYDHEEVEASLNGLGRLARTRPELLAADFAIRGEPSNAGIEGGCNGTLRVELRAAGRRAHSARAWMGVNAIHGLAPALQLLARFEPETIEVDGLAYREGLNAVGVRGGVAGNVIPDEAVLTVNYRFAPDKTGA